MSEYKSDDSFAFSVENQFWRASVVPSHGGLLQSLAYKVHDRWLDVLHTPPATSLTEWPHGGMPLCFPFAGRVFHQGTPGHYVHQDHLYAMPIHGFAHALVWETLSRDEHSMSWQARDTTESQAMYPFSFTLRQDLSLREGICSLRLTIQNQSVEAMPIAPGWHTYFSCDLRTTKLHHGAAQAITVASDGNAGITSNLGSGTIAGNDGEFHNRILTDLGRPSFQLERTDCGLNLTCDWEPVESYRHLILWHKKDTPSWCVEPWHSLPDSIHRPYGAKWLAIGQEWVSTVSFKMN